MGDNAAAAAAPPPRIGAESALSAFSAQPLASSTPYPTVEAPSFISRTNPHEDYQLLSKIGSGTYGDVYKAKFVRQQDVLAAVKVIKVDFEKEDFDVVKQEIVVMKDCTHDNVVSYYGSYLRKNKLWICMEFCGGGSLQDIYHRTGVLEERQIAYSLRETLRGIAYLHDNKKVHRDIKGANILITLDGHIKLADFGIAAQLTQTINKRKSFIGTPYWMAPEVAAVEKKGGYGSACDIWSIGITGIELAELQPPMFDLHPMTALLNMTKRQYSPPTLEKEPHRWSKAFHDFLKTCLVKNPTRRPNAKAVLDHSFLKTAGLSPQQGVDLLNRGKSTPVQHHPDAQQALESDEEEDEFRRLDVGSGGRPTDRQGSREGICIQSGSGRQGAALNESLFGEVRTTLENQYGHTLEPNSQLGPTNMPPTVVPSNRYRAGDPGGGEATSGGLGNRGPARRPDAGVSRGEFIGECQAAGRASSGEAPAARPARPANLPAGLQDQVVQANDTNTGPTGVPTIPAKPKMGAGLVKVFSHCPLQIHCAATWRVAKINLDNSTDSTLNNSQNKDTHGSGGGPSDSEPEHQSITQENHQRFHSTSSTAQTSSAMSQSTNYSHPHHTPQQRPSHPPPPPPTDISAPIQMEHGNKFSKSSNQTQGTAQSPSTPNPSSFLPEENKDYLLFGSNNGIFSLDKKLYYNYFEDATMHQIHHRPCYWMEIFENTMMTISGSAKTPWLYVHDILALHEEMKNNLLPRAGGGCDLPSEGGNTLQRVKDKGSKYLPSKFGSRIFTSQRIKDTKGCKACAVRTNPYDGTRYLVAALPTRILVMEWYQPMRKFMEVKRVDYSSPRLSSAGIRLILEEEGKLPVCVLNVWKRRPRNDFALGALPSARKEPSETRYQLHKIDLNTGVEDNISPDSTEPLNVCAGAWLIHFERNTLLLTFDNHVKIINKYGQLKVSTQKVKCEFRFKFPIETIVSLPDSMLAFGQHVIEGRGYNNEQTQYIADATRDFKLLTQQSGSGQDLVLSSRATGDPQGNCDLYVLLGSV